MLNHQEQGEEEGTWEFCIAWCGQIKAYAHKPKMRKCEQLAAPAIISTTDLKVISGILTLILLPTSAAFVLQLPLQLVMVFDLEPTIPLLKGLNH